MYRFVLRPAWLLSHLFAASLIVSFVMLGFWQLSRHDEKVERNEVVAARAQEPAVPVEDLVATADGADVEELRFREVTAVGTYERGADVLVDNRSHDGLPGAWVVTPLRLDDGGVVAVNRGFHGFDSGVIDPPDPPEGEVTVTGTALPWDARSCGVRTDDDGVPIGTACLRRDAVEGALGGSVLPVALQRSSSVPEDAAVFVPVPLPELDEGPHRSYAVQWFIFATIGFVGYPLILRRVARDRSRAALPVDAAAEPVDDLDAELAELLTDGGSGPARG